MRRHVLEAGGEVRGYLVVLFHEESLAEAVAAVGGAHFGAQQESRVRILVLYAAHHGHPRLVRGVETPSLAKLLGVRNDETTDRVVRIAPVDQAEVVVVGAERVTPSYRPELRALASRKRVDLIEPAEVRDAPTGRI